MGERSKMRKEARRRGAKGSKGSKGSKRARGSTRARQSRRRRRPVQLGLEHAYRGRGGPRPGAGRKPNPGRRRVPHRRRAAVRRDRPLHVTLRLLDGLPSLRRTQELDIVRAAIRDSHKANFRIVHFSILRNHVHLACEADDRDALTRGIQGLKIRMTRRLNKPWNRTRTIFDDRYHDREVATPKQARAMLLYILGNYRKHCAQQGRTLAARWVDPCSSARQLDGWNQNVRLEPGVVQPPRTWLLRTGWRRFGLLDAHEIPPSGLA